MIPVFKYPSAMKPTTMKGQATVREYEKRKKRIR
jgi:hypothetical protein